MVFAFLRSLAYLSFNSGAGASPLDLSHSSKSLPSSISYLISGYMDCSINNDDYHSCSGVEITSQEKSINHGLTISHVSHHPQFQLTVIGNY